MEWIHGTQIEASGEEVASPLAEPSALSQTMTIRGLLQIVETLEANDGPLPGANPNPGPVTRQSAKQLIRRCQSLLFPAEHPDPNAWNSTPSRLEQLGRFIWELSYEIVKSRGGEREETASLLEEAYAVGLAAARCLPRLQRGLQEDVEAAFHGDPAATSRSEIIATYPGFYAIMVYRLAHWLHQYQVPLLPRMMTEVAHSETGIDIHPGATIGQQFFIDHGTGVVIGETTVIGSNVTLYQGVTLGALNFPRDQNGQIIRGQKRHPTIEDDVVIYSGATILGGQTVIGKGSTIGGNVWLTASVPPGSKVLSQPQVAFRPQSNKF